jgi:hypothetical protein
MLPAYFLGLDLGQTQDFTALAVLERTTSPDPEAAGRQVNRYAVRHLERFALGTPYTTICSRLAELFAARLLSNVTLVVDQTVAGRPVIQMLRRAQLRARLRPIAITTGQKATKDAGVRLVPRKELVSTLQILLQGRRLKVSPALPQAQTLVEELTNFKAKAKAASDDTLEAWREGPHDDLVLAVAIAAWEGEHHSEFTWWIPSGE